MNNEDLSLDFSGVVASKRLDEALASSWTYFNVNAVIIPIETMCKFVSF